MKKIGKFVRMTVRKESKSSNNNNNNSGPGNTNPPIATGGTPANNKPATNNTGITEKTVVKTKGKKSSNGFA